MLKQKRPFLLPFSLSLRTNKWQQRSVYCAGAAAAETYDASTMRLARYEGDVTIEDADGKARFVMENVRFRSGESMITGTGATASVNLDDTKVLTLDEQSRVKFLQSGSHMELALTAGTLFLDVSAKLDENETLDITTSTMTVGHGCLSLTPLTG